MSEEYVVETILRARVMKKTPRSKFLVWKYLVKWKGYDDPDENTWEPEESFGGSEHFISNFWKTVDTGGRDTEDLDLFSQEEEFAPSETGRARKAPRKSNENENAAASSSASTRAQSRKRKRNTGEPTERKSPERKDTRTSRNSRKRQRAETPIESPPPSSADGAEEMIASLCNNDSENEEPTSSSHEKPPRFRKRGSSSDSTESRKEVEDARVDSTAEEQDQPVLPDDVQQSATPAHHSRTRNPRVKVMERSNIILEEGITTKTRLGAGSSTAETSTRTTRAQRQHVDSVEQRNKTTTLLTVQKGKLTSVKGRRSARNAPPPNVQQDASDVPQDVELEADTGWPQDVSGDGDTSLVAPDDTVDNSNVVSSPEELLRLAGLKEDADDLQDYEDDAPGTSTSNADADGGSESLLQQSLTLAKDKLFPSTLTSASQSITNALSAAWRRSTIFGPLASGSFNNVVGEDTGQSQNFTLKIDVTISLPVVLIPYSVEHQFVVPSTPNNPPGKFYAHDTALSVLNTVRTGGPCATVIPNPDCTNEQKEVFQQFAERLSNDELARLFSFLFPFHF
ncbi:hypothetical protein V5O48_000469 [Marasmius crinis-equi]|uniref:Chromo domain-containing protein n=1 Tax=Marasmius crinis-equi TaxID=585013 RepID=A0ABR3G261_9AGAR